MKKTIITLLFVFLFTLSFVFAEENTDTRRFEVAQAHVAYQSAKVNVGMETTISYVQGLGGDTTELESIKTDFETLSSEIETFTSVSGLRAGNELLREKIIIFRNTASVLVKENGGDVEVLRADIKVNVEADANVQAAKENFASIARDFATERFDWHYAKLQAIYDRVSTRYGANSPDEVANLKSILDTIATSGDTLKTAVISGDIETTKEIYISIHDLNQEFIQEVKDLSSGSRNKNSNVERVSQAKSKNAEKLLENMVTGISELNTLGYDTTSLQTIYETAQNDATEAESSGDYTAFKSDVQEYILATKEIIGANNSRVKRLEKLKSSFEEVEETTTEETTTEETTTEETTTEETTTEETTTEETTTEETTTEETTTEETTTEETTTEETVTEGEG